MQFRNDNYRFASQYGLPAQAFSDPVITVELSREAACRGGNTAAFLLAVNLLSRTFEKIHAVFPLNTEAPQHPWNLKTVCDVVNELNDTVVGTINLGQPESSTVVLSIGAKSSIQSERNVYVCGSHWCAALDCDLPTDTGEGVFGYLYAASVGAAQVFLHVLDLMGERYRPMSPYCFSMLEQLKSNYQDDIPKPISLPETHLVGIGAVGSAAVYTLAHHPHIKGILHLIDNERVDESNLNRYVLMRKRDFANWKADVAATALQSTSIQTEPYRNDLANFTDEHGSDFDLLLSPVDSKEGRRGLARVLPRRVINAATGGTTVTISTHGFADGKACLHCLYMPNPTQRSPEDIMGTDMGLSTETVQEMIRTNAPMKPEIVAQIEKHRGVRPGTWAQKVGLPIDSFYIKAVCGDGALSMQTAAAIAPLSFISASAGILLAAELVKVGHPELTRHKLDNYLRIDTFQHPNPAFRQLRWQEPTRRCICWDRDYVQVYSQKYCSN